MLRGFSALHVESEEMGFPVSKSSHDTNSCFSDKFDSIAVQMYNLNICSVTKKNRDNRDKLNSLFSSPDR